MKSKDIRDLAEKKYKECLPLLSDYIDHWARVKPHEPALIEYHTSEIVSWKDFSTKTKAFAAKLLSMGLKKGDIVATTLPGIKEHVYLMYACYRIGVTIAPFDLRLKSEEVDRYLNLVKPKAYFFLGYTPVNDFRPMVKTLHAKYKDQIPYWIQFEKEPANIIPGTQGILDFAKDIKWTFIKSLFTQSVKKATELVKKTDPALIIFTTGSTGEPKPALLSHENIHVQLIGLAAAFGANSKDRMLVNLPYSHVAATTEQLGGIIYMGGAAVLIPVFKPEDSLDAIQKYKVTLMGQIPALFNLEWRLPNYKDYDLSSLRFAIYGGQAVSREFLVKLSGMAPHYGSGLGLTEVAGFCSYTDIYADVDSIVKSLGYDSPLCPISIRAPMKDDGTAGDELPKGEIGEVCLWGPQVFLGYLGDAEATRKTISTDGFCYTGDLGTYDEEGLHLSGRRKLVIKPKGYQVFPTEIENFISEKLKDKVTEVACVGVPHEVFSEAIMMFVEKKQNADVTVEDIFALAKGLAAYARPSHVVILEQGKMPLNRVAKTDYKILKEDALQIVVDLRSKGIWDQA